MKAHREQGLCYNCNEKYKPGHLCKSQHLYMLIVDPEDPPTVPPIAEEEIELIESDMEIFINALTGQTGINTIRILGTIKKKQITILIDSSSTQLYRQGYG